ncbi:hypothetical protein LSTR_LSTR001718 [Laodelphax striatellus]|uniref:Uncharacterized protein n=1 Tax=Laodelphax striatellus TaxID=195883 RepID=A0A482XCN6_LAOST|nr:hypothetical protein LSTR_LSTR001718 [Laodelphax striatellus]
MNSSSYLEKKYHELAVDSIKKFEVYILEGNIGRACAHLLVALKLQPGLKDKLVEVFAATLRQWGDVLAKQNKFKELFKGYDLALQVHPDNRFVINDFGAFHYRAGNMAKAHLLFKKACTMSQENVESERNLQMCLSAMVDRWHFRMLNDGHRNEAYREAITKRIKQGFTRVLDIGTGSGLLSLIASEVCAETSGGGPVYACEVSNVMIHIAKSILLKNRSDRGLQVHLLRGHSSHLPLKLLADKRVSLVVTEIMDAGLFGEGVLGTLIDAWEKLLLPPLPQALTQHCSGCSDNKLGLCMICNDEKLEPHQRVTPRVNGMVVPLGATVWVAAIECLHIARKHRSLSTLLRHNLETPFIFQAKPSEPYDSENLQSFPNDFKLLCEPIKCFFVNFNDPRQLGNFYGGEFDNDIHKMQFTAEGNLDAFVVWFDLHVDEDVKISTSPFGENASTCCWDQAIFPVKTELRVVAGSSADLFVRTQAGILFVEISEMYNHIPSNSNSEEVIVSPEFVRFFNNSNLLDLLAIYAQETAQCNNILDFSPFPLLGLMLLVADENCLLFYVAKSDDDIIAVRRIAEVNGICNDRIRYIEECDVTFEDFMMSNSFDIVVSNLVSHDGELSATNITHLSWCKSFLSDEGVIIPQCIRVWGQLISSELLTRSAEVLEEGIIEKFQIPKYMNKYKVKHQVDIYSHTMPHTALSEPFQLGTISMVDIDCHKKKDLSINVTTNTEGTTSGLLQWFEFEIELPECGSTLLYSTRSIDSHANQMCVLMEKQDLKPKQQVKVFCKYYLGGFLFRF